MVVRVGQAQPLALSVVPQSCGAFPCGLTPILPDDWPSSPLDTGLAIGGAAGVNFADALRVEAQIAHRLMDFNQDAEITITIEDLNSSSVSLGLRFDL